MAGGLPVREREFRQSRSPCPVERVGYHPEVRSNVPPFPALLSQQPCNQPVNEERSEAKGNVIPSETEGPP